MRLIDANALAKALSMEANEYRNHGDYARAEGIGNALWAIAHAPTVGGWISVKTKLPEVDEDVLVFAKGKNSGANRVVITYIADSFYFGGTQIKYSDGPQWNSPWQYFLEDYEITHWMPMPEGPKEEL